MRHLCLCLLDKWAEMPRCADNTMHVVCNDHGTSAAWQCHRQAMATDMKSLHVPAGTARRPPAPCGGTSCCRPAAPGALCRGRTPAAAPCHGCRPPPAGRHVCKGYHKRQAKSKCCSETEVRQCCGSGSNLSRLPTSTCQEVFQRSVKARPAARFAPRDGCGAFSSGGARLVPC